MTDVSPTAAPTATTTPTAAGTATSPVATTADGDLTGSLLKSKVSSIDDPDASINKSFTNGDGHHVDKLPSLIKTDKPHLNQNNNEGVVDSGDSMTTSLSSKRSSCGSVHSPTADGTSSRERTQSTDNGATTTSTSNNSATNSISACDMATLKHSPSNSADNTALNSPVSCCSPIAHATTPTMPTTTTAAAAERAAACSNGGKVARREATQQEVDEVARLFEEKPEAFEKWLMERAPPEALARLHEFIDSRKPPKRPSVTSDLFQQWMAASPVPKSQSRSLSTSSGNSVLDSRRHLMELDEGELFMELIRDVANELDIDVLCHKILVNVGLLTHADRGSLFLAKGPPNNKYLVAKLFDVTQKTALKDAVKKAKLEEIRIPFGVGIAGMVAQTKETINIKEAYKDARFNCEIDLKTGYKTNAILSMPICNYEGDVIGVAQIINKTNGSMEFSDHDVEIFRRYLTFCGIGIQNAQLFEMSVQEYRRNQILLSLARNIFEEQNNLECLVTKIMTEARELLKCERCAVFLVDLDCCEASHLEKIIEKPNQLQSRLTRAIKDVEDDEKDDKQKTRTRFTVLFELGASNQSANISRPSVNDLCNSTLAQIAQFVATTGQTVNISDVHEWVREHNQIRTENEMDATKAILCMPIANAQKTVIGVAQLINKSTGLPFTDSDVSIFEAFAIFCGLGIHNTQMYENACKLMAKQKVALECLSYHATASAEHTNKLVSDKIESAEKYDLYSFKFIDFNLCDDDTCRAVLRMFLQCNLVAQFQIPYEVLCRWVLSVRKNYRPVKYHNWRHALNVAQTMFAMLKTGKMERFMTDLEILGLLVACLCHDLDHRGTNNAFQTKTESPLAILYTTSTMEHHHFDQCVMILNSEGNNIFQALSPEDYRSVMKTVENAILSTDLAMYFKKRNAFLELVENGEFDWQSEEKKELLCGMMMTACDVSAIAKPWEVQHRLAKLVADEFFDQGDLEKLQLNTQPIAMMDRERKDELPKMQVGFIDVICLPLYRVLCDTFPWITPLYEGTLENRRNWQDLAEKVEMGLTWIDHDTIDKPVEEFAGCADEEIKDIEFTVTTLNCHPQQQHGDDASTPEHHRGSTRLSIKKTGALGKAVRSKLTKTLYNSMDGVKQKSSFKLLDTHVSEDLDDKSPTSPSQPTAAGPGHISASSSTSSAGTVGTAEKSKKRSKLCSLL
ncbi:PREDICTED: cGMP-specific 3',5'-cyclic phosphodiesterase isoform X2 [Rhagoletis zephyria]|uniref:cGMP-specific 3',5'-cyclic phosphodiesterase isoform X2 n=1 Tax=Rhagoletis zephyria TaxID=28612 RepID=UPI0008115D6C|nr:PREDICTED: cGMP-specific 3',5'-cyclic phosphodiesterase isoform X2 [Rhagoletis zephyria]